MLSGTHVSAALRYKYATCARQTVSESNEEPAQLSFSTEKQRTPCAMPVLGFLSLHHPEEVDADFAPKHLCSSAIQRFRP